jgi:hypothetical protein
MAVHIRTFTRSRAHALTLLLLLACGKGSETEASVEEIIADSLPRVMEGACEGEGCEPEYRAVACRPLKLAKSPTDSAGVAVLRQGDTVDVRMDLHLEKPGVVVLKQDLTVPDAWNTEPGIEPPPLRFKAGDTLLLINYIGEGFWKGMHDDRVMEVEEFWGGPGQAERSAKDSAQAAIATGTAPVINTWLRITRDDKELGWWLSDTTRAILPVGAENRGQSCP